MANLISMFDAEMADFELGDGRYILKVNTGNDSDSVYCIVKNPDSYTLMDEIRFALLKRYGSRMRDWNGSFVDVTDLFRR